MELIILFLNIVSYSIFGYILFKFFKQKSLFWGFFSPEYALFGLLAMYSSINNIVWLYISGIMWAIIVNIFLESIDSRLKMKINYIWFGIFNIFNYYVLNNIIKFGIMEMNYQIISYVFVISSILFILCVSFSLRRLL